MSIYLEKHFAVSAKRLFQDFTHSEGHKNLTGAEAEIKPEVVTEFKAWDGYIQGRNLAVEAHSRILQTCRTSEFTDDMPDSLLEIEFKEDASGTLLCLTHTNIPEDQIEDYRKGWVEHYFEPMTTYYSTK